MGTHDARLHFELVGEAAERLGHLARLGGRPERGAHRLQRRLERDERFFILGIHDDEEPIVCERVCDLGLDMDSPRVGIRMDCE